MNKEKLRDSRSIMMGMCQSCGFNVVRVSDVKYLWYCSNKSCMNHFGHYDQDRPKWVIDRFFEILKCVRSTNGESDFFISCERFYKERGYLTQKQVESLVMIKSRGGSRWARSPGQPEQLEMDIFN